MVEAVNDERHAVWEHGFAMGLPWKAGPAGHHILEREAAPTNTGHPRTGTPVAGAGQTHGHRSMAGTWAYGNGRHTGRQPTPETQNGKTGWIWAKQWWFWGGSGGKTAPCGKRPAPPKKRRLSMIVPMRGGKTAMPMAGRRDGKARQRL